MLDFFADLDIDENVSHISSYVKPSSYNAELHDEKWFLKAPDSRDIHFYRATYYYENKLFQEALEEFEKHLECCDHNRVNLVTIYDSLVHCTIKIPNFDKDKIQSFISKYRELASDYGDQLQYFRTAIQAYNIIDKHNDRILKYIIVLCATVDLPENWLLFKNIEVELPNFEIGYLVRALLLCRRHADCAKGFAADAIQLRIKLIDDRIAELGLPVEKIADAKLHMANDLLSIDDRLAFGDDAKRPAHDCRSKIGKFKSDAEIENICKSFRDRFTFMFS